MKSIKLALLSLSLIAVAKVCAETQVIAESLVTLKKVQKQDANQDGQVTEIVAPVEISEIEVTEVNNSN